MTITFADLGLSTPVLNALEKMGYEHPTPVQEQAIPAMLEGRDVCAAAATGTGKTAAFLLPALSNLSHYEKGEGPKMLVVSPTRELAEQIGRSCMPIARKTRHFMLTVTGGTKYGPQIKQLRRGIDILIATPGRLNDLRERGVIDLSSLELLVLDEADRMLDMGFWPDIESILEEVPEERQTALFSATFDHSIMKNVDKILKDPVMVEIAHHGDTAVTVDQYVLPIENKKKQDLLQATLNEKGADRVIVFTRTKKRADECAQQLHDADFVAEAIHSDKSQELRRRILKRFSRGTTKVLVATDVLARGIDVPNVDYVVNYDLPDAAEDYVHRIGRTGRAGNEGFAVSFSTRESRNELNAIQKLIDKKLPLMPIESYEVDPSILEPKKKKKAKAEAGSDENGKNARSRKKRFGAPPAATATATAAATASVVSARASPKAAALKVATRTAAPRAAASRAVPRVVPATATARRAAPSAPASRAAASATAAATRTAATPRAASRATAQGTRTVPRSTHNALA